MQDRGCLEDGVRRWTARFLAASLLALLAVASACGNSRSARRPGQLTPIGAATVNVGLSNESPGGDQAAAVQSVGVAGDTVPTQAAPTSCPIAQDACDYAAKVNEWVLAGDIDAILGQLQLKEITCPIPGVTGQIGAYPLCEGSSPGERRAGYPFGHLGSEGSMMTAEQFRGTLQALLTEPAPLHLYGLSCYDQTANDIADCRSNFGIAFTISPIGEYANSPGPTSGVLIFYSEYAQNTRSFRIANAASGSYAIVIGQPGQPSVYGTFLPWQPAGP